MKGIKLLSIIIVVVLIVIIVITCTSKPIDTKMIKDSEITNEMIFPYRFEGIFLLTFSNIIYKEQKKEIKIPIFKGNNGDVYCDDIISYCIKKKYIDEDQWLTYIIKCNKGEVRKTFHEFLKFYKSNILKDVNIEKPTFMGLSSTDWNIYYDFTVDNIPCFLEIQLDPRDEDLNKAPSPDRGYKSVYEIIPEENIEQSGFTYKFITNHKTKDFFKWK